MGREIAHKSIALSKMNVILPGNKNELQSRDEKWMKWDACN